MVMDVALVRRVRSRVLGRVDADLFFVVCCGDAFCFFDECCADALVLVLVDDVHAVDFWNAFLAEGSVV